jgi:hypothetical protein
MAKQHIIGEKKIGLEDKIINLLLCCGNNKIMYFNDDLNNQYLSRTNTENDILVTNIYKNHQLIAKSMYDCNNDNQTIIYY